MGARMQGWKRSVALVALGFLACDGNELPGSTPPLASATAGDAAPDPGPHAPDAGEARPRQTVTVRLLDARESSAQGTVVFHKASGLVMRPAPASGVVVEPLDAPADISIVWQGLPLITSVLAAAPGDDITVRQAPPQPYRNAGIVVVRTSGYPGADDYLVEGCEPSLGPSGSPPIQPRPVERTVLISTRCADASGAGHIFATAIVGGIRVAMAVRPFTLSSGRAAVDFTATDTWIPLTAGGVVASPGIQWTVTQRLGSTAFLGGNSSWGDGYRIASAGVADALWFRYGTGQRAVAGDPDRSSEEVVRRAYTPHPSAPTTLLASRDDLYGAISDLEVVGAGDAPVVQWQQAATSGGRPTAAWALFGL